MKLLPLLTLLTLTSCAPKLTPERIKWAKCYCGDAKVTEMTRIEADSFVIYCDGGKWTNAFVSETYAEGCGILE